MPYRPGLDGLRALAVIVVLAFLWSQGGKYRPAYTRHHRLGLPRRGRFRRRWGWFAPTLLDLLGVAALGGLVWFCLRLGEFQPFLYRGAPSSGSRRRSRSWPSSTRARAQEARAWARASWGGKRSYGIYLWHCPVFAITRPGLDVPLDGLPLLALRLTVTVALAHLSYQYVEEPIRRGAAGTRLEDAPRGARIPAQATLPLVGRDRRARPGVLRGAGRRRGPGRTAGPALLPLLHEGCPHRGRGRPTPHRRGR